MVDFAAEGLLDGLEGRSRDARSRLLERLHDDGIGLDELRQAVAEDTLFLLPAERLIGGSTRYTRDEVARLSGMDPLFLRRMRRAHGLPDPEADEVIFTDDDVEAARSAKLFLDAGVDPDDMLTIVRILGRGLSQVADAMRTATLRMVLRAGGPDPAEDELALAYADAVGALEPMTAPMLGQVLNLHFRNLVRTELVDVGAGRLSAARDVAVLFADLVGFTRMGEEVAPEALEAVASRLESLATEVISPPVRFVKTIGDAVMLVCSDVDPLLDAALALVDAADTEGAEFPQLRVGVSFGPALQRAGDWYGAPVNLASRVTGVARPGSVLVTEAITERADKGRVAFSFAGARSLKGVRGSTPLHRLRRSA